LDRSPTASAVTSASDNLVQDRSTRANPHATATRATVTIADPKIANADA